MSMAGGLRLALESATDGERRIRFARLSVSRVDDEREIALVTDAREGACATACLRVSIASVSMRPPRRALRWEMRGGPSYVFVCLQFEGSIDGSCRVIRRCRFPAPR